jgi:hypothetical protein
MKTKTFGAILALLLFLVRPAAASIVYAVSDEIPIASGLFLNGSITTDGNLGVLGLADITGWDLTINQSGQIQTLTDGNSNVFLFGISLSATSTKLLWDYAQHAAPVVTRLEFDFNSVVPGFRVEVFVYYVAGPFGSGAFALGEGLCPDPPSGGCDVGVSEERFGVQAIGNATPLPAALPLFATGLGALGLLGWRRKRATRLLRAQLT